VAVELFEEHAVLLEVAEDFLVTVRRTPRIPLDQLSRKRVRLSALLRQHRATEEEFIFGPMARDGGFARMPDLQAVVQELMSEKAKYSEHIRKWTLQAIDQDWRGYVAACEERLQGFKRVILDEEEIIYQAVLGLNTSQVPRRARNF
jgi:hypothetical protein